MVELQNESQSVKEDFIILLILAYFQPFCIIWVSQGKGQSTKTDFIIQVNWCNAADSCIPSAPFCLSGSQGKGLWGKFILMSHIYIRPLGNMEEAKKLYGQAHAIFLQCFGPDHFNTKKAARGLAAFWGIDICLWWGGVGAFAKPGKTFTLAVADTLNNMLLVCPRLGMSEKRKELLGQAHAICMTTPGPDHPSTKNAARGLVVGCV